MIKTVTEQRETLAAFLASYGTVLRAPVSDPIPPVIMIGNPSYLIDGRVATVSWPISLIVARTTAEDISKQFDAWIEPIIGELVKGVGLNFVVDAAAPRPTDPDFPVDLPAYVILGHTNIALC